MSEIHVASADSTDDKNTTVCRAASPRLVPLRCRVAQKPLRWRRRNSSRTTSPVASLSSLRKSGWQDAWLDPPTELFVGCVLLVLSGIYWWNGVGSIWQDWQTVLSTVTVVLGPWFVYRAWQRHDSVGEDDD